MEQNGLANHLTEEEKQALYDYRNSEAFKVFQKAVVYLYQLDAARLSVCKQEELPVMQGRLQGLLAARNILVFGTYPPDKK